ncbi:hypothetical protein L2E82_24460 [Cichorium intybus]|uniref:Uncharacterized protein n=1 Tax=Cichorium intybus TaxID=13427 RepID=A0ACB9E192_CICIN|nr:hypothetical protein L2E82_24460 [Cichorium intybus]
MISRFSSFYILAVSNFYHHVKYEFEKEEKLKNAMTQEFDIHEFWKMKLPPDNGDLMKRLNPLAVYTTKNELFSLIHKGILFDGCEWVFSLKEDGIKCELILAKRFLNMNSRSYIWQSGRKFRNKKEINDQVSLKYTLPAVRNAAQAAARIQAAFRAQSFNKRKQKEAAEACAGEDEYCVVSSEIQGLSAASKSVFGNACDHNAALFIQKKYRCWNGRKDFLALRQKIVKIQVLIEGNERRIRLDNHKAKLTFHELNSIEYDSIKESLLEAKKCADFRKVPVGVIRV